MKIVQIAVASGEPIVGLGDDGLVYTWFNVPVAHWELYGNEEAPIKRCLVDIGASIVCNKPMSCEEHN